MNQPGRSTPLLLMLVLFKKLLEAGVLFVAALLSLMGSRHRLVLEAVASLASLRQRPWGERRRLGVFLAMLQLEAWDLLREPSGGAGRSPAMAGSARIA